MAAVSGSTDVTNMPLIHITFAATDHVDCWLVAESSDVSEPLVNISNSSLPRRNSSHLQLKNRVSECWRPLQRSTYLHMLASTRYVPVNDQQVHFRRRLTKRFGCMLIEVEHLRREHTAVHMYAF
jgi:hypothetical protein